MRYAVPAMVICAVSLFGCVTVEEDSREMPTAEIQAEVEALLADFRARMNAGDWESTLDLYADDARFYWMEAGRRTYESKDEIAEALTQFYSSVESVEYTSANPRITILSPRNAVVTSEYTWHVVFGPDQAFGFSGVMTVVLERGDDGWQFLIGHVSTLPDEPSEE